VNGVKNEIFTYNRGTNMLVVCKELPRFKPRCLID
jgi:hypothetical protein